MRRLYNKSPFKAIFATVLTIAIFAPFYGIYAAAPKDPLYIEQASFYKQIQAESAWDITTGTKKVVVALIDTGLDIWHEDLRDNLWVNPREVPENNIDDDRNGFVDDVNGWNFVEKNNVVRPSVFDIGDDKEAVRHGTIAGGLIGAKGNNGLDGTGVSQNVSIMTLRAIRSNGNGSLKAVNDALNYAIDNGADVISISFVGESYDSRIYDTMRRAYEKNIVIVVAAGNFDSEKSSGDTGKKPLYPGCYDSEDGKGENWIITVGSVDDKDQLSDFSEYGKCVDIMAPGEYIYSTERYAPQYGYASQFGGPWFGTSFATPLVAGTVALIKSIHPEYTARETIETIIKSADNINSMNSGIIPQINSLRLNTGRAVSNASAVPLRRGFGGFWYFKNGEIWRYDIGADKTLQLASLPEGRLVNFMVYNSYLKDESAIIMRRNGSYYLDVYKNNSDYSGSFLLPNAAILSEKFLIRFTGSAYFVISYSFNSKTNKTNYKIYNTQTKKIISRSITGQPLYSEVNGAGEIYAAFLSKGILSVKAVSNGKIVNMLRDVSKVYDIKIAGNQVVILLSKGGRVALASAALNGGQFTVKTVSAEVKKSWNLKALYFADKLYYLPFTPDKGSYILYDSGLSEAQTIVLPQLPVTAK